MNEWDDRAGYYRESRTHAEGDDLDQVVVWCEPACGVTALDVATGGGHVARRLRALGCRVTTCDAAAGMEPEGLKANFGEKIVFWGGGVDTQQVLPFGADDDNEPSP